MSECESLTPTERRAYLVDLHRRQLQELVRLVNRTRSPQRREDLLLAFAWQHQRMEETVLAAQELMLRRFYGDEPLMN